MKLFRSSFIAVCVMLCIMASLLASCARPGAGSDSGNDVQVPTTTTDKQPQLSSQPSDTQNDIGKQITDDVFAITVLDAKKEGDNYVVTFTLTYSGETPHALNAKERIFVVNDERRSVAVYDVFDIDGNSLLGTSVQKGQTITLKAAFTLPEDFVPSAFRYVYDTMGFRRIQAQL